MKIPQYLNAKFLLLFSILVMSRIVLYAQCSSAIPINFDYDPYNNQVLIELTNFGYNTYQLYNKVVENESAGNANNDYYSSCTDQYNPKNAFMDIWDELPGNVMRFPGGTASQLYHSGFTNYPYTVIPAQSAPNYYPNTTECPYANYTSGTSSSFRNQNNNLFKGYGVKNKSGVGGETLLNNEDFGVAPTYPTSIWENLYKNFDPAQKRNIIYDFIEIVKAKEASQGKQLEVLYVFNIITHFWDHSTTNLIEDIIEDKIYTTPAHTQLRAEFMSEMNENLNTLRFLLNNGINVVGVEMGNELTHGRYKDLNLSPNEYIEIVKQYAGILRTDPQFSGIKIGVVGEVSLASNANLAMPDCDGDILQDPVGLIQLSTTYNLCWNVKLKMNTKFIKENITYPLYDAFIIHKYFKSSFPNIYNINDIESFGFFISKIEDLKTIYLSNNNNEIQDFKIWFTEWNQDATVISNNRKSENTRYIYDIYSYLTQYNALYNGIFEYTTFHNFLGASPISLLNSDLTQRDNIKAHYLMNKLEGILDDNLYAWETTSTKTSNPLVSKSGDLKFLDINVSNNKFWLREFGYLTFTNPDGAAQRIAPINYPPICLSDVLYKTVYFTFNNSTTNSYCLNPLFKNTSIQYSISPTQLVGNTLSPVAYIYTEDPTSGISKGFNNTPLIVSNSSLIPPKSIGYVKYTYSFDPLDCYGGARLANNVTAEKNKNNALSIFPNPSKNKLFISGINFDTPVLTTIFDVQGRAQDYKLINNEIDISDLPNGIYFLSLENEGILFHQKFVIQK